MALAPGCPRTSHAFGPIALAAGFFFFEMVFLALISWSIPYYRNKKNGEYESDFIRCILWDAIATSTSEYCKKGDIVGIKGRIQVTQYEQNNEKKYLTEVVAEKVTFLSSKKQEETEE